MTTVWMHHDTLREKGRPLPKFGEWDVNDPSSAEGFTVIFNKARDEKKTGGKPDSPSNGVTNTNRGVEPLKPQGIQLHSGRPVNCVKNGFAACRGQAQNLDWVYV
ncbi:hypothetical protein DH2020_033193 [Rehmannia glutinosa]|uniref:RIN4 pathogenic type III effector avirulence factor Avr cleavage site domain-containing protein n=1 Tax=Rehmannia glutinosa TaxID=99300 RepID=A0ABR0VEP9_REHGL